MSIKIFGKGLGLVSQDASTQTQPDQIIQGGKSKLPAGDNLRTTLQFPSNDTRRNDSPVSIKRPVVDTGIKPKVFSAESGEAPFETLFHDFNLEAFATYNFWTPDELTNERDELGNRKLEDVPRYITLRWSIAPNLIDPRIFKRPSDVRSRDIRPVIFSREHERPQVFQAKGIGFTPEHLQLDGFKKIKGIIANGHLAPGVVEAIVDIPLKSTGIQSVNSTMTNRIDEDTFLCDPGFAGLSIHEMVSQMNQITDGIASMANSSEGVGEDMRARKEELVDGKFTISKSMRSGGKMDLTSVHPSSPSLGYASRTATTSRPSPIDDVMSMTQEIMRDVSKDAKSSAQVKVKFFNPAIGGLLDQKKINLMSAPEHVESLSAMAPALADLEIISRTDLYDRKRRNEIPSFPSPRVKPLEYIGYIIEKYRRQGSGAFIKVEEIDVPSRTADIYYDTKIVYGEVYRYRIKSVLRWTRKATIGVDGSDPTVSPVFASQTGLLAQYKSSYFSSEWGHTWAYTTLIDDQPPLPPDEFTVRPESHKKRIVITFRLPENPQKDIWKMRLYRKFKDEVGRDITDWMQVVESDSDEKLLDFAPGNVIFFDTDVDFFQKSKTRVVYAAQCISRHGEQSYLSEQFCTRLNSDYFSKGEYPVEFVSSAGIRREYFGAFSTSPVRITKTEIVVSPPPTRMGRSSGVASLSFSGRDVTGNATLDPSKYVCRIQSLDTGETIDVPFNVTFDNLPARQEVAEFDFYVPKDPVPSKEKRPKRTHRTNVKDRKDAQEEDSRNEDGEVKIKDRANRHERW